MGRKRLTQIFPFLLPVRVFQRKRFFYAGMRLDGKQYAKTFAGKPLPYKLYEDCYASYNDNTGYDMVYQENKIHNLNLAAKTLHLLLIQPGETFSFWGLVRYADRHTPYKEGLVVKNGKLTIAPGGGLCQMSNLLFWMFLHTPLTIVERSGHDRKTFPDPNIDEIKGVDATVAEGWIDLKVRNDTGEIYQIAVTFDRENTVGTVYTDRKPSVHYEIANSHLAYVSKGGKIFEYVDVERLEIDSQTGRELNKKLLYTNISSICYPLPENIEVREEKANEQA